MESIYSCHFPENSTLLFSGGRKGRLFWWETTLLISDALQDTTRSKDSESFHDSLPTKLGSINSIKSLSRGSDSTLVVVGEKGVKTYNANLNESNGSLIEGSFLAGDSIVETAVVDNTNGIIVTGSISAEVKLWDLSCSKSIGNITIPRTSHLFKAEAPISSVCARPSASEIIVSQIDGKISIFDSRSLESVRELSPDVETLQSYSKGSASKVSAGHAAVTCLDIDETGNWLLSGSSFCISMWHIASGSIATAFPLISDPTSVKFINDRVVATCLDPHCFIFKKTGAFIHDFKCSSVSNYTIDAVKLYGSEDKICYAVGGDSANIDIYLNGTNRLTSLKATAEHSQSNKRGKSDGDGDGEDEDDGDELME